MKLNVPERSVMLQLIPKKVGELTASAARRLQKKIELNDEDLSAIGTTERPPCSACGFPGGSFWSNKKALAHYVDIRLNKWEVDCLAVEINKLREKNELPIEFVDTVAKFEVAAKLVKDEAKPEAESEEEEFVA